MIQVCLSGWLWARFALDAAACRQAIRPMRWRLMIVWCLAVSLPAPLVLAQVPTASREELMRKWDLDRDGKVDASETEIARSRMRRARTDAMLNSGTDPVTGRPRVATDPVTGRPMPRTAADGPGGIPGGITDPADDGGLILLPGTGEAAGGPGNPAARQPPARSEREALPGTRVPALGTTLPSLTPPIPGAASGSSGSSPDPTGRELSSRARILPNTPRGQNPVGRDPQLQASGQQPGGRPGVIAGGMRPRGASGTGGASGTAGAGTFGGRPGYGGGGPPADLNAGRLPAGLPQSRGTAPGAVGGGRSGLPAQTVPGQSTFRTGRGAPRGPTTMPTPSTGMPTTSPRPGMRQPDAGRRQSQTPPPRPPRVTSDDFYGR